MPTTSAIAFVFSSWHHSRRCSSIQKKVSTKAALRLFLRRRQSRRTPRVHIKRVRGGGGGGCYRGEELRVIGTTTTDNTTSNRPTPRLSLELNEEKVQPLSKEN